MGYTAAFIASLAVAAAAKLSGPTFVKAGHFSLRLHRAAGLDRLHARFSFSLGLVNGA